MKQILYVRMDNKMIRVPAGEYKNNKEMLDVAAMWMKYGHSVAFKPIQVN